MVTKLPGLSLIALIGTTIVIFFFLFNLAVTLFLLLGLMRLLYIWRGFGDQTPTGDVFLSDYVFFSATKNARLMRKPFEKLNWPKNL